MLVGVVEKLANDIELDNHIEYLRKYTPTALQRIADRLAGVGIYPTQNQNFL